MVLFWIFLMVIGGIAVALQAQIMGAMSAELGWVGNVFIAYVVGVVVSLLLVLVLGKMTPMAYLKSPSSWYYYSAGIYGVIIIGVIGIGSYKLGLLETLVTIFVSQITFGKIVTHYGLLNVAASPILPTEIIALVLLIGGTLLLLL